MEENPGTETVESLLAHVHEGEYVIPHFQRGFEWQPSMVCDLIQSVLQDYYAGLILLWELKSEEAAKEEWEPVWGAMKSVDNPRMAILDGQQRLASLYYAIYNPKKTFPNRQSYYIFFLELNHALNGEYEEAVTYSYYGSHQTWKKLWGDGEEWAKDGSIPLCILSAAEPTKPGRSYLDSRQFEEWIRSYIEHNSDKLPDDITALRISKTVNNILKYRFTYFPLTSKRNLPDICNIFARVNEKGMKLSTFDLMNAFLYPKGIKLRKELWEKLDNEALKSADPRINEYLLKLISLIKQSYCSSKFIYNLVPGQKVVRRAKDGGGRREEILVKDADEFTQLWRNACRYAEKARRKIMNTGTANFGAIKAEFIPNTTVIPVLGAILWVSDADHIDQCAVFSRYLSQWYWSAVLSEDYSGSSDTIMSEDFRDWKSRLSKGLLPEAPKRFHNVDAAFVRGLDFSNARKGSALYNAIICLLALNGAKDFYEGQTVGVADYSGANINDHHIFPKAAKGLPTENSTKFEDAKDFVLNRTLLLDETNKKIREHKPSAYVAKMIQLHGGSEEKVREILRPHFITSTAFDCLKRDDFDQFLIEREQTIKEHLIQLLNFQE